MSRAERRAEGRWIQLNDGTRAQVVSVECIGCGVPVEVFIHARHREQVCDACSAHLEWRYAYDGFDPDLAF